MNPLRVGLIADVQHADIENAPSPYGATRYYRDAVNKAKLAAEDWAEQGCAFAVNLGDTIDRRSGPDAAAALARVLQAFGAFSPILHVPGNHDLSALPRDDVAALSPSLGLGRLDAVIGGQCYCDVRVGPGWRALIIDTYDVAVRRDAAQARTVLKGLLAEARKRRERAAYLTEHEELNGAVGERQLAWLAERLQAASESRERVVVLGHASLHPDATIYGDAVCWNCREVSSLLDSYSHIVAAVITGHDHRGLEAASPKGVYHRVLEAAMEGEPGVPTHAVLELDGDVVRLLGRGQVQSWECTLPPLA